MMRKNTRSEVERNKNNNCPWFVRGTFKKLFLSFCTERNYPTTVLVSPLILLLIKRQIRFKCVLTQLCFFPLVFVRICSKLHRLSWINVNLYRIGKEKKKRKEKDNRLIQILPIRRYYYYKISIAINSIKWLNHFGMFWNSCLIFTKLDITTTRRL